MTNASQMLIGALVADAACLGTHWIYDPDRIVEIADREGRPEFTAVNLSNYENVKGYFAHGARTVGMQTQIGEVLRLTITSMNANNRAFDAVKYQAAFAAHFGAGGTYQGYIDGPTKAALSNIAAEVQPSGSDDDQTPALARLPAIMARYHGTPELPEMIKSSLEVTHVNPTATAYTALFAATLDDVMDGKPLDAVLTQAVVNADPAIQAEVANALNASDVSTTDFAGRAGLMGRACGLGNAGPVIVHVLANSASYAEAITRNIHAAGDNAGRSIMIGAIMAQAHGIATPTGIPLDWVLELDEAAKIWKACVSIAG
ncbi:MAG: ADP-ribosylglycohydrolase family protein [Yoonia sp.]